MSPLADTVSLVDGEEGYLYMAQQIVDLCHQFLRRDIEEFHVTREAFTADDRIDGRIIAAVEGFGLNTVGTKALDLVFHQADERGDNDGGTRHRQCGNLIADALAATRWHQHQGVLALHDVLDDFLLVLSE